MPFGSSDQYVFCRFSGKSFSHFGFRILLGVTCENIDSFFMTFNFSCYFSKDGGLPSFIKELKGINFFIKELEKLGFVIDHHKNPWSDREFILSATKNCIGCAGVDQEVRNFKPIFDKIVLKGK
ncbi:MAG: hypothetical protein G01um101418_630 [Parcubacteria group bacterium Gr01-1014_18]|nr:MAG: hypothetical protein Greene041636_659 [Parcubacteria group bacterium Greene0416_36]TSC80711.1 MAG: hypothetical protein G01um101418_630 [Parcubacteria group bacterium Gr01-1014_18]TSC98678.1 MAG: hypothetical protein Greene101420_637 [Parcubacteria group bacterium Greene1014_20]TSD07162.1 MAG: hypothetical protein Greene07142_331 [Parcubacteria group bacterium Greene0714_2]